MNPNRHRREKPEGGMHGIIAPMPVGLGRFLFPAVLPGLLVLLPILDGRAENPRPLMRDFIGINGHTILFKPELYQPVCRQVRDYHPVEWDLAVDPATPAPFPFAKNRVDWSKVYGAWREKGWGIDVSLMFESIPLSNWKNLEEDAKSYGAAFAREFGPSGTRKLVDSVEIGNEPGKWSDPDYRRMFQSMAEGVRAGDPQMKIATCNLAVGKGDDYSKSVDCVAAFPQLFDILNIHSYALLEGWPTWRRSFPEDPKLPHYLQDIDGLCHWRDEHCPEKPVWLTEFGYDSTTQPSPKTGAFTKWVGVTDLQQAQWLVRSFLVFSAMPIERAYLYFFNDEDKPMLHSSSGITRHFVPKPSYYALEHLQQALADYRFQRIVTDQPGELRVQEYQNGSDPHKAIWAVWSPTGSGRTATVHLDHFPGKLIRIEHLMLVPSVPGTEMKSQAISNPNATDLSLDESPTFLFFEKS